MSGTANRHLPQLWTLQRRLKFTCLHDPAIQGCIAPGGKIDFPESPGAGAIRGVREETGLLVKGLVYRGLHQFADEEKGEWYVIYNYLAESFEGEILQEPGAGALVWVSIRDVPNLPALPSFKRRFPLFFKPGAFEIHTKWSEAGFEETITQT